MLAPTDPRYLAKTLGVFADIARTETLHLKKVEGVAEPAGLEVRKLLVGDQILLLHVIRRQGVIDPWHQHDDHESMGYLIRGRLHLKIGGDEMIATPGICWVHPAGVPHWSVALEEVEQIEIKSPPRKTWEA